MIVMLDIQVSLLSETNPQFFIRQQALELAVKVDRIYVPNGTIRGNRFHLRTPAGRKSTPGGHGLSPKPPITGNMKLVYGHICVGQLRENLFIRNTVQKSKVKTHTFPNEDVPKASRILSVPLIALTEGAWMMTGTSLSGTLHSYSVKSRG